MLSATVQESATVQPLEKQQGMEMLSATVQESEKQQVEESPTP